METSKESAARLFPATVANASLICAYLADLAVESRDLDFQPDVVAKKILHSFNENVYWFIFYDADGEPFGVCYCQSVHNYWRSQNRFYVGGFYIAPTHRGQGHFRHLIRQLKSWAKDYHGVQLYAHIHDTNEQSRRAFTGAGFEKIDYSLFALHWGAEDI